MKRFGFVAMVFFAVSLLGCPQAEEVVGEDPVDVEVEDVATAVGTSEEVSEAMEALDEAIGELEETVEAAVVPSAPAEITKEGNRENIMTLAQVSQQQQKSLNQTMQDMMYVKFVFNVLAGDSKFEKSIADANEKWKEYVGTIQQQSRTIDAQQKEIVNLRAKLTAQAKAAKPIDDALKNLAEEERAKEEEK